jgi:hypothetical protein
MGTERFFGMIWNFEKRNLSRDNLYMWGPNKKLKGMFSEPVVRLKNNSRNYKNEILQM